MRHAKSSWDSAGLADFDRPLNDRGLNAAPFMGEYIARHDMLPDRIICSPAKRALQTALLIRENAGISFDIKYDERIYDAGVPHLLKTIWDIENPFSSAMIVGHNPGLEDLTQFLTNRNVIMPTAAIAVIDLEVENWKNTDKNSGSLIDLLRPRDLMA